MTVNERSASRSATRRRRRRRTGWALVAVSLVGLGAATAVLVTDIRADRTAQADRRTVRMALHAGTIRLEAELAVARADLDAALDALATHTAGRDERSGRLERVASDLAGVDGDIGDAELAARFRSLDLAVTKRCLAAVERALEQVAVDDFDGAADSVSGAAADCRDALSRAGSSDGFPAVDADVPDASLVRIGAEVVAVAAATDGSAVVMRRGEAGRAAPVDVAVAALPDWAAGPITEPALARIGESWVLVHGVTHRASGLRCIRRLVAEAATGPFAEGADGPLVCHGAEGGANGPALHVDAEGNPWLLWATPTGPGRPARLWSAPLSPDASSLAGDPVPLLAAGRSWERGTVRAPAMGRVGATTWLLHAGGDPASADQGVGAARCEGPAGPCTAVGDEPVLESASSLLGPGGPSFLTDRSGRPLLAFHAWVTGRVGGEHPRRVYLGDVVTVDDGTSLRITRRPST